MKFIDEIDIYVASGNGGNGLISFSNIKNRKTTADGGNGGNGGNVYICGNKNCSTLYKLILKAKYRAQDGWPGKKNCKTGKNGNNLYINVPLGTFVYDNERKVCLGEIINHDYFLLIIKGGTGGIGNNFSKNKNINSKTLGEISKLKFLHLELYLLAHIGLLGYPNAGKSLFLNKLTNAQSKVDFYEFTTLHPHLGELKNSSKNRIIIADIPGIIQKASLGKGLGFTFLKHLSKTELLFHIVDSLTITTNKQFFKAIIIINNELKKFNKLLFNKEKWLIINKIDLISNISYKNIYIKIISKFNYRNIFFISLYNKTGIKKLTFNIQEYFLRKL
ncbi:MAG TPA: GTPase ObgE [Candidatus Azoamicus sp. OHIO2]